jgi:hypothetical protein
MNTPLERLARPLLVAGFEVRAESYRLADVIGESEQEFHLATAAKSPPGYQWFDIYVDAQRGERRAALTAHTLLSALVAASEQGWLDDFRILFGKQWLQVGDVMQSEAHPSQLGELGLAG